MIGWFQNIRRMRGSSLQPPAAVKIYGVRRAKTILPNCMGPPICAIPLDFQLIFRSPK